jgi:hypothetical protein
MDDYEFIQHRNLYNTTMYDRDDPLTVPNREMDTSRG